MRKAIVLIIASLLVFIPVSAFAEVEQRVEHEISDVVTKWGWYISPDYADPHSTGYGPIDDEISGADPGYEFTYKTERVWHAGGYRFAVPNGTYKVVMLFAEIWNGITGPFQRYFDVYVNGERVARAYDPYDKAGGVYKATKLMVDDVEVEDGQIEILLWLIQQAPKLNGLLLYDAQGNEIAYVNCGYGEEPEWLE